MADTALHGMQQGCRLVLALYALQRSGVQGSVAEVQPLTPLRSQRQVRTQLDALTELGFAWCVTSNLVVVDSRGRRYGGREHRYGLTPPGEALAGVLLGGGHCGKGDRRDGRAL